METKWRDPQWDRDVELDVKDPDIPDPWRDLGPDGRLAQPREEFDRELGEWRERSHERAEANEASQQEYERELTEQAHEAALRAAGIEL